MDDVHYKLGNTLLFTVDIFPMTGSVQGAGFNF